MKKSIADQLRSAYSVISDPRDWCQGAETRGRSGRKVNSFGRHAVQWCAYGALRKARAESYETLQALNNSANFVLASHNMAEENCCGIKPIVVVNDELGYEGVQEMYCHAIERAEMDG